MSGNKEKVYVIGIKEKGRFKKVKWRPNQVVISMEQYLEYKKLQKEAEINAIQNE